MFQSNNSVLCSILIVLTCISCQTLVFGGIKYTHDLELKYKGLSKKQKLIVYLNGGVVSPVDNQMEQDLNESMLRKGRNEIHVVIPRGSQEKKITLFVKDEISGNVLKKVRFRTKPGSHKFTFHWEGFSKATPYEQAEIIKKLTIKDKNELQRITKKLIQSYTNRDLKSVMNLRRKYQNESMSFLKTITYKKSEGKKSVGESVTVDDLYEAHRKVLEKLYGEKVKEGAKRANSFNVRLSPYNSKFVIVEPNEKKYLFWLKSGLHNSFSKQYMKFLFIRIKDEWELLGMLGQQKEF